MYISIRGTRENNKTVDSILIFDIKQQFIFSHHNEDSKAARIPPQYSHPHRTIAHFLPCCHEGRQARNALEESYDEHECFA